MTIPTLSGSRFTLGRYEIVAMPIAHSAHMLRYTVYVDGKRLGAVASMPSEADCRLLEHPQNDPPPVYVKPDYWRK